MRILQILPELEIGGVERGCLDLARQLLQRNHQAFVISNGGTLVKDLELSGARHICLPVHKKSLLSILMNIPKVAKILQEEKIDIVHARSRVPALIAFLACRRTGTFFVTTCHGYYSQSLFSRIMGWGKRVIVSSEAISRHMIEDFTVPQERIRLVPRGVDLEEFRFSPKSRPKALSPAFTIGLIGRLTPLKGHKYLLQALSKVIRVFPGVRAVIVGDISPGKEKYKEELLVLTRRLSLDRYVQFLGRQKDIPRVLSQLDALVLPTVTQEAFGRVLIEAAASGVAIIATRVGGIVDIIEDGVDGILVEPKNPMDLASAIIRVLREPALAQRLITSARKKVEEKFSLQQMTAKTIKIYEEVQEILNILVIKLSALGDVILAVPSLRALRDKFPGAHIAVLVAAPYRSILENCPYINQVLEFPLEGRGYKDILDTASLLRKVYFDIVIDLQNNRRSHLLSFLSGSNRRYGYDNGKLAFFLNRKIKEAKAALSPIEHQGRALKLLGVKSLKEDLELWPDKKDEIWAEDFLKTNRNRSPNALIGINLGASIRRPSKRWAIEKYAALLDKLQDAGMAIVITGKDIDKKLLTALRKFSQSPFIDALGKSSIMQLAALIKHCNVYITGDSAPLHIAYAMKTPVVALFGPTDPLRHTIGSARQAVIRKKLSCSPCYKRRCRRHTCMQEISVEEVFEAVKSLLGVSVR